MLYILYQNSGVYSGRVLRKKLDDICNEHIKGGFPNRFKSLLKRNETPKLVVNLGTTEEFTFQGDILNTPSMVRAASNKRRARITFQDAGVPSPTLFLCTRDILANNLPVIGRTSYHRKGRGFWFCKTRRDLERAVSAGATHFLEFIDKTREYRIHTFIKSNSQEIPQTERTSENYISIKISEKVWQGGSESQSNRPQKNHEFGWSFLGQQNRRAEELDVVRYAAKQAIASLGMDFGAVDVMYKLRTKKPFVLEVNSTPSMSDNNANTCTIYAQRIIKLLNDKQKKQL